MTKASATPSSDVSPVVSSSAVSASRGRPGDPRTAAFMPLIVDVGIPLGGYYLLSRGFGVGTVGALAISSVPPVIRALWTAIRWRKVNGLAGLMLAVNVIGIIASVITGDPRLILAKDGAVSSTVGIAVLVSVAAGRPLMSAAMKPMAVKGDGAKLAAWERMSSGSAEFRAAERAFSLAWGVPLVTECVVRVVCAYTLPVHTMVWLQTVFTLGAIGVGLLVSRPFAERIGELLRAEVAAAAAESV